MNKPFAAGKDGTTACYSCRYRRESDEVTRNADGENTRSLLSSDMNFLYRQKSAE